MKRILQLTRHFCVLTGTLVAVLTASAAPPTVDPTYHPKTFGLPFAEVSVADSAMQHMEILPQSVTAVSDGKRFSGLKTLTRSGVAKAKVLPLATAAGGTVAVCSVFVFLFHVRFRCSCTPPTRRPSNRVRPTAPSG